MKELSTLKKRDEFLTVAKEGKRIVSKSLILQAIEKPSESNEDKAIRVGFTVSKRVGGAVCRNRVKRRLRSVAAKIMPDMAKMSYDYVIIGRTAAIERPFNGLEKDLKYTLYKIHS